MKKIRQNYLRIILVIALAVLLVALSFYFASELNSNEAAMEKIRSFGYLGILIVAIIGGLNVIIPIPAAVFTPIFTEAGFSIITVVLLLVIGTVIADLIGYSLGRFGRAATANDPPELIKKIETTIAKRPFLVVPITALYAAFAPLPNEILLIPLGLAGFRSLALIPALLIGNAIHQMILVFGVDTLFNWIF